VGSQGIAEVFSLHATKVFGIGEGGVVFAPKELADRVRTVINFGIRPDGIGPGTNGKLSEYPCAVGLAVLDHIASYIGARRRIAYRYIKRFESRRDIKLPCCSGSPPWQSFPIQLAITREARKFVERAAERGVELRRYYRPALHTLQESRSFSAPM
jgi:dTDP-4-amino-4,6-dideoxygalactose transaminase